MDCEFVKGKPLTKEESMFLLNLIEGSKIITTKTTNATNNKWIRLAERFNATATNCPRTPQQLRLKWENMKENSLKRSTKIRMNQIKIGGGPADYIPPDDILDRVTGMLGSTATGFTVPFGGDKETAGCGDGDGGGAVVTEFKVVHDVDQNLITPKTKRFTFGTPTAVRKKFKQEEIMTTKNIAVAEYFTTKKRFLDVKLNNIHLENESLELRNIELKLKNEKLLLETQKLKLELEKLKEQ